MIAVNRSYGKSDYIPCICWEEMQGLHPVLKSVGMFRYGDVSRAGEYVKKLSETETEKRVAYEVSVSKVEFIEDEE